MKAVYEGIIIVEFNMKLMVRALLFIDRLKLEGHIKRFVLVFSDFSHCYRIEDFPHNRGFLSTYTILEFK